MSASYILTGIGETCEEPWDMSLRLGTQAVVRPMGLTVTGVNSKVARTRFHKKAQWVTGQSQNLRAR